MVLRIPLTFDPDNPKHLREIEETNRMPPKVIKKAWWIKPINRRTPGQSCAHAIFTITLAAEDNTKREIAKSKTKDTAYLAGQNLTLAGTVTALSSKGNVMSTTDSTQRTTYYISPQMRT